MKPITVVGVGADSSAVVQQLVATADLVVGAARHLAAVGPFSGEAVVLDHLDEALQAVMRARTDGRAVCVLASGDPGWFGIGRALAERFGPDALDVHPAPSSVSVAFARLGLPWDDARVVSAHGRPPAEAARLAAGATKAAVLTSPASPPEALAAELIRAGACFAHAAVCTDLGGATETILRSDLGGIADGRFDGLSVLVLWSGTGVPGTKGATFGAPEAAFEHRDGMITKSEVRSVILAHLELPGPAQPGTVLWDIGAGSGSVAVEAAGLAPWMDIVALDRDPAATETCATNARAHGVALRAVTGEAPAALADLPDPDRVFVGGGGMTVLRTALDRIRDGGVVVATHAAIDRAAAAADLLGNLVQLRADRGRQLPGGGWRLEATNPVFVTWGSR